MAKLYFRYGTVGSAKTMNLLAVAHNYQQQNKQVLILKPRLDIRFGLDEVKSRTGLVKRADMLIDDDTILHAGLLDGISCVVVDEAQFLTKGLIDQLRAIATVSGIPVICYGLRTDFRGDLFEGAKRLFEVADTFEEIKTTCNYCNKKAIFNLKLIDGKPTLVGPTVELGAEEKYLPTCASCYRRQLESQYFPCVSQRADNEVTQGH